MGIINNFYFSDHKNHISFKTTSQITLALFKKLQSVNCCVTFCILINLIESNSS